VKTRIQNPAPKAFGVKKYRIQKVEKCGEDAATGTVMAETGQWRAAMRVQPGKGGQAVGKWAGFSHIEPGLTRLCPDKSTQVVDFPYMCMVRLFCGAMKSRNEKGRSLREFRGFGFFPLLRLALRTQSHPDVIDLVRTYPQNSSACYAKVRVVSRKSTKVRTGQARKSAMLRIVTGKTNFFD
jgi:hypothetical protein